MASGSFFKTPPSSIKGNKNPPPKNKDIWATAKKFGLKLHDLVVEMRRDSDPTIRLTLATEGIRALFDTELVDKLKQLICIWNKIKEEENAAQPIFSNPSTWEEIENGISETSTSESDSAETGRAPARKKKKPLPKFDKAYSAANHLTKIVYSLTMEARKSTILNDKKNLITEIMKPIDAAEMLKYGRILFDFYRSNQPANSTRSSNNEVIPELDRSMIED